MNMAAHLGPSIHRQSWGGCNLWTGCLHGPYKRPIVKWQGECRELCRLVWEAYNGPIPEGLFVCHKCDIPACFLIEHLWLGTCAENQIDMAIKGRGTWGERAKGNRKLTLNQVENIRKRFKWGRRGRPGSGNSLELAEEFGVTRQQIYTIARGKTWKPGVRLKEKHVE